MANNSMTILELFHQLSATKDIDFLREGVKVLAQAVMEPGGSGEDRRWSV